MKKLLVLVAILMVLMPGYSYASCLDPYTQAEAYSCAVDKMKMDKYEADLNASVQSMYDWKKPSPRGFAPQMPSGGITSDGTTYFQGPTGGSDSRGNSWSNSPNGGIDSKGRTWSGPGYPYMGK